MNLNTLDLIQFHWWQYQDKNYLDALKYMMELQLEGKIKHLALTNFDTEHLQIILESGIKIVSNQVQFSLVDRRPEVKMVEFCQQNDIKLLTYGSLCGGFLSEKYLGRPEPKLLKLNTVSLRKYYNTIKIWGSWQLFQKLLSTLKQIADKHHVSIANVAVGYILNKPSVGGVIVGAKLGITQHIKDNVKVFNFTLDDNDLKKIDAISNQSQDLYQLIGDCGDEYRR
jgi:aryl-alcohol dehydrogenase-like predicted oxidoreductase